MSPTLALKYRPRTFQDMVGQQLVAVVLHQMAIKDVVPTGLFFSGPRGTGKTSAARILAAARNCTGLPESAIPVVEQETTPCTLCDSCLSIQEGTSVDVIEVDAASKGSVADIRELIELLRFRGSGEHRVVIIDECHSMSREAFNALLKTLEEPPSGTTFVLVTTEPEKVPETVLSRLMEFEFRRVSPAEIFQRVSSVADAEGIDAEVGLFEAIAQRSEGSVRDALMSLDQIRRAGITTASDFRALTGDNDASADLLLQATTGDIHLVFEELERQLMSVGDPNRIISQMTSVLRDLLILRSGGTLTLTGHQLEARISLNQKLEPERVINALKTLWDFKTKIRATEDPRSSLDIAMVLLTEIFTKGKNLQRTAPEAPKQRPVSPAPLAPAPAPSDPPVPTLPTSTPSAAPRKLSLAEMMIRK